MSDETNNPGDKPVNDGGNAPQPEPEPDDDAAPALVAEKPKDDGGGSA